MVSKYYLLQQLEFRSAIGEKVGMTMYSRHRLIRSKSTRRFSVEFGGDTNLTTFCLCPEKKLKRRNYELKEFKFSK